MIIDAHAHIFREINGNIRRGTTRSLGYGKVAAGHEVINLMPPLNEQTVHTAEMLLAEMDEAGVDKSILLQGPFYGECNSYVTEAVRKYEKKFIGSACLDPWERDFKVNASKILDHAEFAAIKLECSESTGYFGIYDKASLADEQVFWLCGKMENLSLALVLDLGAIGGRAYATEAVRDISKKFPALKIVICHLGQPGPHLDRDILALDIWKRQIELGASENIWFDTSSIQAYFSDEGYPFPGARRYFEMAVKQIGADKIMWGTDVPGLLRHATYAQLMEMARIYTSDMSAEDRGKVLHANASDVFAIS